MSLLGMLHCCQMFLNVLQFSDICNTTGNQILLQCWARNQPAILEYAWPHTQWPEVADWRCWQAMLTNLLHLGHHQTLTKTVGSMSWDFLPWWLVFNASCAIWHKTSEGWMQHGQLPGQAHTLFFHCQGTSEEVPQNQSSLLWCHWRVPNYN